MKNNNTTVNTKKMSPKKVTQEQIRQTLNNKNKKLYLIDNDNNNNHDNDFNNLSDTNIKIKSNNIFIEYDSDTDNSMLNNNVSSDSPNIVRHYYDSDEDPNFDNLV